MTTAPPPPAAPPGALRIVLFGLSGSGKSSLLAALGQAAAARVQALGGRIEDRGDRLGDLLRQGGAVGPPGAEVTAYPVQYVPGGDPGHSSPVNAVFVDSDGRAAGRILADRDELDFDDLPEGTLGHEIGDADGLILVLDAAAPPAQVEGTFAE